MIRSLTWLMLACACAFAVAASLRVHAQAGATSSQSGVVVGSPSGFPDATVGVKNNDTVLQFEAVSNIHGGINNNDNFTKSTEGLFAQENQ